MGDVLKRGDLVQVTGTSKGKGFAGVMKRWGFAGGPRTHGQSDRQRSPGSIGQGTTPGRVHKGKKMPGRMGDEQVTVKNLIITNIHEKDNEIEISGPIPGVPGNLIIIKKIGSGKLSELVQDVPTAQIQEGEEEVEGARSGTPQPELRNGMRACQTRTVARSSPSKPQPARTEAHRKRISCEL